MSRTALETNDLFRQPRAAGTGREMHRQIETLTVGLRAALAREQVLIRDKEALSQRQVMLAQEFEHRLLNRLQIILSLTKQIGGELCISPGGNGRGTRFMVRF